MEAALLGQREGESERPLPRANPVMSVGTVPDGSPEEYHRNTPLVWSLVYEKTAKLLGS